MIRKGKYDIAYPKGRWGRLLIGRETTISYEVYNMNKSRIVMPGEPLHGAAAFRVVSGAEEIIRKQSPENPTVNPEIVTPQEPPLCVTGETGEVISPKPDIPQEPENENITIVLHDTEYVEKSDVLPEETATEPAATEEHAAAGKYDLDVLSEMVHKELNELLEAEGIEMPRNVNKQQKIDALMKLNG